MTDDGRRIRFNSHEQESHMFIIVVYPVSDSTVYIKRTGQRRRKKSAWFITKSRYTRMYSASVTKSKIRSTNLNVYSGSGGMSVRHESGSRPKTPWKKK